MPELEVRLSGSGGQGILLIGRILAEALTLEKLNVAQSQSYEPTSRGGLSRSDLVASSDQVDYPLATSLDYLVILHNIAAGVSDDLLKSTSLMLIDSSLDGQCSAPDGRAVLLPVIETARGLGSIRSTNMVALGALLALGEICEQGSVFEAIKRVAPARLVESAIEAVKEGYRLAGSRLVDSSPARLIQTF
jgi:2-oxoglutarate ferredoxin oxidoreductase subunit gamma